MVQSSRPADGGQDDTEERLDAVVSELEHDVATEAAAAEVMGVRAGQNGTFAESLARMKEGHRLAEAAKPYNAKLMELFGTYDPQLVRGMLKDVEEGMVSRSNNGGGGTKLRRSSTYLAGSGKSPDGKWTVSYDYSRGEQHPPMITRLVDTETGEEIMGERF